MPAAGENRKPRRSVQGGEDCLRDYRPAMSARNPQSTGKSTPALIARRAGTTGWSRSPRPWCSRWWRKSPPGPDSQPRSGRRSPTSTSPMTTWRTTQASRAFGQSLTLRVGDEKAFNAWFGAYTPRPRRRPAWQRSGSARPPRRLRRLAREAPLSRIRLAVGTTVDAAVPASRACQLDQARRRGRSPVHWGRARRRV